MKGRLLAFLAGGAAFLAAYPALSAVAVVLLVGFLILFILAALVPGGRLFFYGLVGASGLFGWLLKPFIALVAAAFLAGVVSSSAGFAVGGAFAFVVGGIAGVVLADRLSRRRLAAPAASARFGGARGGAFPQPRQTFDSGPLPKGFDIPLVEVSRGWLGGKAAGVYASAVRSGVIVVGEGSLIAARALVAGALKSGARVVVIGSPYAASAGAPAKLVSLDKSSVNLLHVEAGNRIAVRRWAENIAIPLVVSSGLDTAETGMVIRFLEKFAGGKMTPDDVDKLVAEYGPTSSARLKDALGMLTTFFGEGYPEPEKLFAGEWRQLVIDTRGLSQSAQLFVGMYLLYEAHRLFPGCVLVFDSAELGIPEQQILPYDARHVWLRTLKAVERLKQTGFVMLSSTGLLAPELMDLADTYVVTRGPVAARRNIAERVGLDLDISALKPGEAVVFTKASPDGKSYLFRGMLLATPVPDVKSWEAEAERQLSLLRAEGLAAFRDTLLYAELADLAEAGYRALKFVKRSQAPTKEKVLAELGAEAAKAAAHLLEKHYLLLDPAGVLGLTTLGEQAIRDWEAKARKAESAGEKPSQGGEPQGPRPVAVDAGLGAYSRPGRPDFGETYRQLNRARQLLMRGDSLSAVGAAYRAAVTALKRLTGVEKGHLPELAEKAREKGLVNVADEEARRLYAANIEAKRLLKEAAEGRPVSEEDRKRMEGAAELLISLAERVAAFSDGLGEEEEVSNV